MEHEVVRGLNDGLVPRYIGVALRKMDAAITQAIALAKDEQVPQGLISSILHAHALRETHLLIDDESDD